MFVSSCVTWRRHCCDRIISCSWMFCRFCGWGRAPCGSDSCSGLRTVMTRPSTFRDDRKETGWFKVLSPNCQCRNIWTSSPHHFCSHQRPLQSGTCTELPYGITVTWPQPNRKFFSSSRLLVLFCRDLEIESKPAETFSEESEARKVLMFCDGGALNSLVVPFFCAAFIYFYTDRSTKLWRSGRPLCRSIWTETENLTTIFISELWDEKSKHRDFYCHEGGEKTGNIQIQPAGVAALIWTVSWLIFSNRWIVSRSWRVLNSPSDRSVPGGSGGRASPHPEDVQHQRRRAEHLPPAGGQQPGLVLPAGGGGVGSKEWELQSSLWKETLRHKPPILKDKSWLCVCPCAGAGMPTELDNMESRWVMYRYCTGDVCKASEGLTAESRLRLQAASPGEQSDGRRGEDARHPLWAEEPGGVLQEEAGGSCLWSAEVLVLVSRGRRG